MVSFSFFVWEKIKRFDGVFLSFFLWDKKKQNRLLSKKWRLSREKKNWIHSSSHVLYIKPLYRHTVGVQKGRRRLFDDDDALSSV